MKTTLVVSAALLFSTASFAQTTIKNTGAVMDKASIQNERSGSEVNNSGSAYSATSIHSNDVNKMENKSLAEIEKEKKSIAAKKHEAAAEAKAKGEESKKMTSQDATISVSTHSSADVNSSIENNKFNSNASLNNSETVSSDRIKSKGRQIKNDGKAEVKTQADGTIEKSNRLKSDANKTADKTAKKVNRTSSATVNAGAASAHSFHTRPVSVKAATIVRTNAGIKIR